jgi:endonuclease YncB( thermonuclease family)
MARSFNSAQLIDIQIQNCHDGDTCTTTSGEKIRFACIDAPELKQPYGIASRDYLRSLLGLRSRSLLKNRSVAIVRTDTDRFGRTVAELYVRDRNDWKLVQKDQIKSGLVWANSRYKDTCPSWKAIEAEFDKARAERKGIFAASNPLPPWEWRKRNR